MTRFTQLGAAALALAGYAWTVTSLKPLPQGILVALPLLTFVHDRWARTAIKPTAFLVVSSFVALVGLLFACSELVALADQRLFHNGNRVMPVTALAAGSIVGIGIFAVCYFRILKPGAQSATTRRAVLAAVCASSLIALGIDRLFE
jgi:hypothetical protein